MKTLLLFCMACVLAGCSKQPETQLPPRPVRTMIVAASVGGGATTYTAEVRSRYETDLSFQVSGKVINRPVDAGMTVKPGTVLAQLDPTDLRVSLEAAKSAVNAARAELARVRSEEARYRDLLERGLTTRAAYLAQQTAVKTGQAQLERAQAEQKLSEQRLAYSTLRADSGGVVTGVMTEVGAVVAAGQKVMSLAKPDELEAIFDVPDSRIDEVRTAAGAQVAMLNMPAALYPASVRTISPSADPVTRTYQVKTTLQNPPAALRLGMSVIVTLLHQSGGSSIALPSTALFQKDKEAAVWIVKQDMTLELRPVGVQRYESDRVYVNEGLTAGERVVTAGVHRLAVGDRVRLMDGTTK